MVKIYKVTSFPGSGEKRNVEYVTGVRKHREKDNTVTYNLTFVDTDDHVIAEFNDWSYLQVVDSVPPPPVVVLAEPTK